jgi:hypothetical protein
MGLAWTDVAALLIGATCFVFILALATIVGFAIWAAKHPGL